MPDPTKKEQSAQPSASGTHARELRDALEARFGETFSPADNLAGVEVLNTLAGHRTCRSFAPEPVSPELLRLISACALSAPSKSDLQQGELVMVSDSDTRNRLADLVPKMEWVREAPAFFVVCANNRRLRQMSRLHDLKFANDHLDAFFNAAFDAGILLSNFIVAANAVGLGTCAISAIRNHCDAVSELLELPDHVFPTAGLCVGWPAIPGRLSSRLSLGSTLHENTYDDSKWKDLVLEYDNRRGIRDGWDPHDPRFVGWSKQKAKMYSVPQRSDFGEFIRKKGFSLD